MCKAGNRKQKNCEFSQGRFVLGVSEAKILMGDKMLIFDDILWDFSEVKVILLGRSVWEKLIVCWKRFDVSFKFNSNSVLQPQNSEKPFVKRSAR